MNDPYLIAAQRSTHVRYLVLLWLCLAASVAYISRNSLGLVAADVRTDLGLTDRQMGWAMSAFFLSYSLLQIPAGWLTQRWGSRRALSIFASLWSIASVATGMSLNLPFLVATRLANGAAQAGLFAGSTTSIARWFPSTGQGFANGSLSSFMSVGGALGGVLTGLLLQFIGWRWTMLFYGLWGWIWAAGFAAWFRDSPTEHPSVSPQELELIQETDKLTARAGVASSELQPDSSGDSSSNMFREPTPWMEMFTSPALWWICAQQLFRASAFTFFGTWFAIYLQETRGISEVSASYLTSLPLFAVVVGGMFGGALSDKVLAITGSRRLARQGVAVASLLMCAALVFVAYGIQDGVTAVIVISAATFCFSFGGPCAYTITIDMGGRHVAMVFSVMNMSGNIGAFLFPLIVPELLLLTKNWDHVLILFGALFILAAACWMMLNPNGTVFDQSLRCSSRKRIDEKGMSWPA